jgi:hypothetical protein
VTEEIEFVNERERLLFARSRLGSDVLDFLRSSTGKYLHGRAKADYESAKEELIGMSMINLVKYWRVKRRAVHAQTFMKYCVDAIQDGDIAYQELQQES